MRILGRDNPAMPAHLHVFEGGLWDHRRLFGDREFRPRYAWHHRTIDDTAQLRATIRAGKYAWPGGYEVFFVTSDGACLCMDCATREYRQIANAVRNRLRDGWRVEGTSSTDWCDDRTDCDHCGRTIYNPED